MCAKVLVPEEVILEALHSLARFQLPQEVGGVLGVGGLTVLQLGGVALHLTL